MFIFEILVGPMSTVYVIHVFLFEYNGRRGLVVFGPAVCLHRLVCRLGGAVCRLGGVVCRLGGVVCRLGGVVCRLGGVVCLFLGLFVGLLRGLQAFFYLGPLSSFSLSPYLRREYYSTRHQQQRTNESTTVYVRCRP